MICPKCQFEVTLDGRCGCTNLPAFAPIAPGLHKVAVLHPAPIESGFDDADRQPPTGCKCSVCGTDVADLPPGNYFNRANPKGESPAVWVCTLCASFVNVSCPHCKEWTAIPIGPASLAANCGQCGKPIAAIPTERTCAQDGPVAAGPPQQVHAGDVARENARTGFGIPGVVCDCNFDHGHSPECAVVKAHEELRAWENRPDGAIHFKGTADPLTGGPFAGIDGDATGVLVDPPEHVLARALNKLFWKLRPPEVTIDYRRSKDDRTHDFAMFICSELLDAGIVVGWNRESCEFVYSPPPAVPKPMTAGPDYDHSIHSNPDARAWAKFWIETWTQLCRDGRNPLHPEADINEAESWMNTWFANAMMAMHDHLKVKEFKELDAALGQLRLLNICEEHEGIAQRECPLCELEAVEMVGTPVYLPFWQRIFLITYMVVMLALCGAGLMWVFDRIFNYGAN